MILNEIKILDSKRRDDYEILIKEKYDSTFISYCPQLNKLIKSNSFESVYSNMEVIINKHIEELKC
ncbi:MAG: hypothetical protein FWG85_07265 [Bacteroidetes bacterium]|nr:hypothetical protein [Bacteroidota bacterium]